jgi:PAS domain S-box-containing protein
MQMGAGTIVPSIARSSRMHPTFSASIRRSAAVLPRGDAHAERLAAITPDLLAAADQRRHLTWTNPAWQRLLGWTASQLAGGSYHRLVHPGDRARVRAAEALVAGRAGEQPEIELRLRSRSGSYHWFVFSTSDSPAAGLVYLCGKDISARKRDEAEARAAGERRRTADALLLSEARYEGLIARPPGSTVLLFDDDLRLLPCDGGRMRGHDPQAIAGQLLIEALPAAAYAQVAPAYRAALAGETRSFDVDSSDGGATYSVQTGPLIDARGRVIGGMAVSRDISDRRRAERLLEERASELERSNAELEQFAFVASHDLSEPLRMVSSYLQLLRRRYRGRLDADADEVIDFAVDGAARMRGLIDDLLSYSHAGRADEPFEPVDLWRLAERAAERLRSQAVPAAEISVGPLPTLAGNAQGLDQLFQNLIANAVKFVPAGQGAEVEIGAERSGANWRFTVSDNGIGLDPGQADQIFRMFERLHSGDEYPGTGIGLAIAEKVVARHGGRIWAESRPEGGSRFCFTLPAA